MIQARLTASGKAIRPEATRYTCTPTQPILLLRSHFLRAVCSFGGYPHGPIGVTIGRSLGQFWFLLNRPNTSVSVSAAARLA